MPPNELFRKVKELNDENHNRQLEYYLVGDMKFVAGYDEAEILSVNNWRIIIGHTEEYVYDGSIYKRLIIDGSVIDSVCSSD